MPCAQFKALEACPQARHERGVDSDKSTIDNNDDNNDEDAGDPQGEPAFLETRMLEERGTRSA